MNTRFNLRNLYLYSICLITLLIAIFAMVSIVQNTVELIYPDPSTYPEPNYAGSLHRQAVLSLVGSITTLLISGPVYLYHWRKVQSEKAIESTPAS